jgi:hypothetical protein
MNRDDYQAYLRSPEWQRLRQLVSHREHGLCQGCGVEPGVEVHHLSYARVGQELLLDLALVCAKCHGALHTRRGRYQGDGSVLVPRGVFTTDECVLEDEDAYLRACEERARERRARTGGVGKARRRAHE